MVEEHKQMRFDTLENRAVLVVLEDARAVLFERNDGGVQSPSQR